MPLVKDLILLFEIIAPPAYAEEWDNIGLLAGSPDWPVRHILFTVDVTAEVIQEAEAIGADMIFCHHPLIFKPLHTVTDSTYEGSLLLPLLEKKIALYAAHTNLDAAPGGVNDTLCNVLGLQPSAPLKPYGFFNEKVVFCGCIAAPIDEMTFSELAARAKETLQAPLLSCFGEKGKKLGNIAVCCGAGDSVLPEVLAQKPDAFLTGEIKYHTAQALKEQNIPFIGAGHFYTERPVLDSMIRNLQNMRTMVQYTVTLTKSLVNTDPCDYE